MPHTYPNMQQFISPVVSQKEDHFMLTEHSFASYELQQRVLNWLRGVPGHYLVEDLAPVPTRAKTRISAKPYARPESSKPLARRVSNIPVEIVSPELCNFNPWPTYGEVPAEITHTIQQNPPQYQIPLAKQQGRGLNDLPERGHNPLVTHSPDDLREEYRRIVSMYNSMEERRQQIEGLWCGRGMPPVVMEEVLSITNSLRRLVDSAQYIVDFASEWGIDVDFYQIFSRYRCPPFRQCNPVMVSSVPQQIQMYMHTVQEDSRRRNVM